MKVIDSEIGERGLSRILVENGLGDLKVKIGNEEISCVKSILINGNDTIRKLLLDDIQCEVLELYEKCDLNSFLEVEKYYSGGIMELNENNVCGILRFSVYYNDSRIMRICKKYLKNHLNDSIMIEIFSVLNGSNINRLNDLRDISEEYMKLYGYKYLNNDELLMKLNLESIKFIFNNKYLIIKNETWLLNRLLKWYKMVLKKEKENDDEDDLNKFMSIMESRIHLNEIKKEEIEEENIPVLKELDIELLDEKTDFVCLNMDDVTSDELIKIVHKYYTNDEEIILDENELQMLDKEEIKEEMIKLLYKEEIGLVIIILNIIVEMRMNKVIPNEIKNKLLSRLLCEYNQRKNHRIIKCLCLFIKKKYISIIECLCGKEVMYKILNYQYYLSTKLKEILVQYIQEMKQNGDDENEIMKTIVDVDLLDNLIIKEITSFSYPQSEYVFFINNKIAIIPSYDGLKCEFSSNPSLPTGIAIDEESGRIHGKVKKPVERKTYTITCKNDKSEMKFKLTLKFVEILFLDLNRSDNISITSDGKIITKDHNGWNHCYLNLKMVIGVHRIKFKFRQNRSSENDMFIGLSTGNTYSGNAIHDQSTTCNYYAFDGKSQDITQYCHIGKVSHKDPKFNNHGDGSVYEMIVDMNKREFSISHNGSPPVVLVKHLPSPLYPYIEPYRQYTSVEIISATYEE